MPTEQGDTSVEPAPAGELATVRHLPVRDAAEVVDAELVDDDEYERLRSQRGQAIERYRGYQRDAVTVATTVRTVATHQHTQTAGKAVVRHLLYIPAGGLVVAKRVWEAKTNSRYERLLRAAELTGDWDRIGEWEQRAESAKERRHHRRMDLFKIPFMLAKASAMAVASLLVALLLLGFVLFAASKNAGQILAPLLGFFHLIAWISWAITIAWGPIVLAAPWLVVLTLHHLGRTRGATPTWVAPPATAQEGTDGRAILPTADMILSALRHLGIAALDKAFKDGYGTKHWPLQIFEGPVAADGLGYMARIRLPQGCDVEKIVAKKPTLAHNLVRTQREVWITEPSAAVLGLWMANPGALSGPVPPWPLLAELESAQTDYWKSVPVGFDLRGDVVNARFFECNHAYGGAMGSGKSTLAITGVLGAMLDPIVEIDVFVCAPNNDFEPMRPRLRTLEAGTSDAVADAAVACMQELYDSIEYRGRALQDKTINKEGSRSLTRAMAQRDPKLRPRIVLIDECQRVFADHDKVDKVTKKGPTRGEIATDVAVQLVNAGRKYGITLILLTPEPTGNSLPRKLMSVFTHKACGAIGDQTSNDAVLNTGSYKAGISAVGLDPKTDDALNDCGTLMTRGFMAKPGLLRSCYVNVTDAARITERAMQLREGHAPAAIEAPRDVLADVETVLRGVDVKASDVCARLRHLAPGYPRYAELTAEGLAELLDGLDVPVKLKDGYLTVRVGRVRAAIADRDTTE
jgi:S-DNA-T family DNA segregation ATPase FtsK/SpoIIIE